MLQIRHELFQRYVDALNTLLGEKALLHPREFAWQHGPVQVGRALHDLPSETACELIVEAAAEKHEMAADAQALHFRWNRCLDVDLRQHFDMVGVGYQKIVGRPMSAQRLVEQRLPLPRQVIGTAAPAAS